MEGWANKIQVKKGDFAEDIVHKYLENKGYIVYKPATEGSHAFDRLAIKGKRNVIIAEIKAKARLNKFPETGFETKHYKEYRYIRDKHKLPIFIFFVDEMLKEMYGNFLSVLEKNMRTAPWGNQVLFQLSDMKRHLYDLSEDEVLQLKKYSSRKHDYKN